MYISNEPCIGPWYKKEVNNKLRYICLCLHGSKLYYQLIQHLLFMSVRETNAEHKRLEFPDCVEDLIKYTIVFLEIILFINCLDF